MRQSFFACRFRQLLLLSVIAIICACKPSKMMIDERIDVIIEIVTADSANVVLAANGILVGNSRDSAVGVYRKKNVSWFIGREAQNVNSFYIEMKDVPGSEDIFTSSHKPPSKPTKAGGGKVKDKKKGMYIYSIIWTDKSGKEYTFDPKISIMPD